MDQNFLPPAVSETPPRAGHRQFPADNEVARAVTLPSWGSRGEVQGVFDGTTGPAQQIPGAEYGGPILTEDERNDSFAFDIRQGERKKLQNEVSYSMQKVMSATL